MSGQVARAAASMSFRSMLPSSISAVMALSLSVWMVGFQPVSLHLPHSRAARLQVQRKAASSHTVTTATKTLLRD